MPPGSIPFQQTLGMGIEPSTSSRSLGGNSEQFSFEVNNNNSNSNNNMNTASDGLGVDTRTAGSKTNSTAWRLLPASETRPPSQVRLFQ